MAFAKRSARVELPRMAGAGDQTEVDDIQNDGPFAFGVGNGTS